MTQEQIHQLEAIGVKAATAGFVQTLVHKGHSAEEIKTAAAIYAAPEKGLLVKRAAKTEFINSKLLAMLGR